MPAKKVDNKTSEEGRERQVVVKTKSEKRAVVGWVLLLLGGLSHMLPEQMAPLLKLGMWGVSLQIVVGIASVILALNFLLED